MSGVSRAASKVEASAGCARVCLALQGPSRRAAMAGWLLVALAASLAACGGAQNRGDQLRDSVRGYNDALRWGRIERAAEWIPLAERPVFLASKRSAAGGLNVHDVEIRGVQTAPDGKAARVRVALTFSRAGDPRLETHVIDQLWRWSPQAGWMLHQRVRVQERAVEEAADPSALY